MRVLLTIFEIQDYGGIVGDVEYLAKGLREHGHECDLVILRPNSSAPYTRKSDGPKGSYPSQFGGVVNTLSGWYGVPVIGYACKDGLIAWKRMAEKYDLVIHEIPNPKNDEGGWWRHVYNVQTKQIIAAHDAHYRDMYPYIAEIADKVVAITCTNHAGYVALEHCPIPRAFIGAAHEVLPDRAYVRQPRAVSAHVWKAWKHMEKVVAAGPLLQNSFLHMAGDGIEGRYMRSKDKCKPKYVGLWDKFVASDRCTYHGLLSHDQLFTLYQNSTLMVDLSYSKKFAALGNHFNRSILEAANNGVVSLCTSENMRENNPQVVLFEDHVTHIPVGKDASIPHVAALMEWAIHDMHPDSRADMVGRCREILDTHFNYKKTCLQYLELAEGKPAGIYPILEKGAVPGVGSGA